MQPPSRAPVLESSSIPPVFEPVPNDRDMSSGSSQNAGSGIRARRHAEPEGAALRQQRHCRAHRSPSRSHRLPTSPGAGPWHLTAPRRLAPRTRQPPVPGSPVAPCPPGASVWPSWPGDSPSWPGDCPPCPGGCPPCSVDGSPVAGVPTGAALLASAEASRVARPGLVTQRVRVPLTAAGSVGVVVAPSSAAPTARQRRRSRTRQLAQAHGSPPASARAQRPRSPTSQRQRCPT